MKLLNKITVKDVVGGIKKGWLTEDAPETRGLMRIIGQCEKVQVGMGDNGEWYKFHGTFEAIDIATGEVFRSGKCCLPALCTDVITSVMSNKDVKSADFAFDIGIRKTSTVVGYEYTCQPLFDVAASDPLAGLKATLPALPAPPPQDAPAALPAPEKKK